MFVKKVESSSNRAKIRRKPTIRRNGAVSCCLPKPHPMPEKAEMRAISHPSVETLPGMNSASFYTGSILPIFRYKTLGERVASASEPGEGK